MINPHKMQLNEKIDYVLQGKNLQDQAARAQEIVVKDATFAPLMSIASQVEQHITCVPEGSPDTLKFETDIPAGVADTTVRQEFRRIRNFLPGGTMEPLPRAHRETSWANLLLGVHYQEAEILGMIKDQTLFVKYPQLRNVLIELGVPVSVSAPFPGDSMPAGTTQSTTIPAFVQEELQQGNIVEESAPVKSAKPVDKQVKTSTKAAPKRRRRPPRSKTPIL